MKERRTAFTLSDAPQDDLHNLKRGFEELLRAEQKGINQLDTGERQQALGDLHDLADVLDELDEILGAAPKKR